MTVLARHYQSASYLPAPARLSPPQLDLSHSPPAVLVKNFSSTRLEATVLDVVPLPRVKVKKRPATCYVIACDQSENAISDTEETPQVVVLNYAARRARMAQAQGRPGQVNAPPPPPPAVAPAPQGREPRTRSRKPRVRAEADALRPPSPQPPVSPITVSPPTTGSASTSGSVTINQAQAPPPPPAPVGAVQTTAAKAGETKEVKWNPDINCHVTPRGHCRELQTSYSMFCPKHTCQAINEDGGKCGNMVIGTRSQYCRTGFHQENNRLPLLNPLRENRLRQNAIHADHRLVVEQEARRWLAEHQPHLVDLPPLVGQEAMNTRVSRNGQMSHETAAAARRATGFGIWGIYEDTDWIGGLRTQYPGQEYRRPPGMLTINEPLPTPAQP